MSVGQSGTASQSGTSGFLVHSGTSYGALGASGTGGGSVPIWNGSPIAAGVSPGAQLLDSSDVLEIDLGARHFFFENGSAVAVDLTGTGRNASASLSFSGTGGGVYTRNNTLDDGTGLAEFANKLSIGNNYGGLSTPVGVSITDSSGSDVWNYIGFSDTENMNFGFHSSDNVGAFGIYGGDAFLVVGPSFVNVNPSTQTPSDDGSGMTLQVSSISVGGGDAVIDDSGNLHLNNSFQSGGISPTGYLIIYDNTGTPYEIPAMPQP